MLFSKKGISAKIIPLMIILIIFPVIYSANTHAAAKDDYFFDVSILSDSTSENEVLANLLAQELRRIRINSQIISHPSGTFEAAVTSKAFDVVIVDIDWPNNDVDPTYMFAENGAVNYWGIDTIMSGGQENEDYLLEGKLETDESQRISIYHEWQENLMDNILPVIPIFNSITTYVSWDNLNGWDHEEGIIASLPYMDWSGKHHLDQNQSVFVDYTDEWDILNPLFVEDDFFASLVAEPLIRLDKNNEPEGVLAKSWSFNTNQTILTINLRDDVYWQPDVDEVYTNELFDADDVIFSIQMYQNVSTIGSFYKWIKMINRENDTTIHLYIDGDPDTYGLQPYAPTLYDLAKLMLPEHYLNVSVEDDGLPNTTNDNWGTYGLRGLGTGMYFFKSYSEGVESIFSRNDNWWGSTPAGYVEVLEIGEYKVRFLAELETKMLEFQAGRLDVFKDYYTYMDEYDGSTYQKQTKTDFDVTYLGFNMKSELCPNIGEQTLCEDGTMSKGLAVRKAIAHMVDKSIQQGMMEIELDIIESPFSNKFGSYIYNEITTYATNLEKAKEFMLKAGYDPSTIASPGFSFLGTLITTFIVAATTTITVIRRNRRQR
ncbi:MAG: hypothetical protein HZR80_20720 [Candidatus Heimdallarchaeota archaeon]